MLKVLQLCSATLNCLHILLNVLEMADSHLNPRMNYRETYTVNTQTHTWMKL